MLPSEDGYEAKMIGPSVWKWLLVRAKRKSQLDPALPLPSF